MEIKKKKNQKDTKKDDKLSKTSYRRRNGDNGYVLLQFE